MNILFETRRIQYGQLGLVTLNRHSALNALTHDMIKQLSAQLTAWEEDSNLLAVLVRSTHDKAFCAGGDIITLYEKMRHCDPSIIRFFEDEYRLNQQINAFSKPYISLLDGMTMGGGIGISLPGSFPILTERTTLAMPETTIGFFPDIGGTHWLTQAPGACAEYLALTGARLSLGDALYANLSQYAIATSAQNDFLEQLYSLDLRVDAFNTIEQCLATLARPPADSELASSQAYIDQCFAQASVEAIIAELTKSDTEWHVSTLKTLQRKSPTSLKISLEQTRRARRMSFEECLQQDFRLVQHFVKHPDFVEGIRALLIDKDKNPHWQPAKLEAISTADIAQFFESRVEELQFIRSH